MAAEITYAMSETGISLKLTKAIMEIGTQQKNLLQPTDKSFSALLPNNGAIWYNL